MSARRAPSPACPAYLGLDIGGTGAKAGVFDESGRRMGQGHVTYAPSVSPEGRAEIPITRIYEAARDASREAIAEAGVPVAALAISSQGQTFVSLDTTDRPLHPAILWYDSRAAAEAEELGARVAALGAPELASGMNAIAVAPKILWLRRHGPRAMERARRYLLLPDYLNYRLTGEAVTDPSTAASTGLYAYDSPDYSRAALAAAETDRAQLARIQPPGTIMGRARPEVAAEWGLSPETLVVVGTNDQYAGALGAGNCRPGILSETTGTCLALVTLARRLPEPMPPGLLGGRFPIPECHFVLAYSKTAGLVLDWFRRELAPGKSMAELDAMAAAVPPGSRGVVMLHHFDGMVSPHPNPGARGAFCGLSLSHTAADLYRSILESIAFSLRENLELLREAGLRVERIRSIGGGARSDLWLQVKADLCGLPVERPEVTEAATLGSAMLAATGAGRHASLAEASEWCYRAARTFTPNGGVQQQYQEAYAAYRDACEKLHPNQRSG